MFAKNGNVAIPTQYNDLSRVTNGFVVALKGAKKAYWNDRHESSVTILTGQAEHHIY